MTYTARSRYDLEQGLITIDGAAISCYDVHHLRRNIGVVSQDNVLFSMSIWENIICGMGKGHLCIPTDDEITLACERFFFVCTPFCSIVAAFDSVLLCFCFICRQVRGRMPSSSLTSSRTS